jgi:hypothetical protein
MPRSNLCVSRNQKRYEYVSAVLFTGLTVRHISDQQASDKMGVSLRTLQNRKGCSVRQLMMLPEAIKEVETTTMIDFQLHQRMSD